MVPVLHEIRSRTQDNLNTHSTTDKHESNQESSSVEPPWDNDLAFLLGPRKDGMIQNHTLSPLNLTPNYYRYLDNSPTTSSDTENEPPDFVPHAALAYLLNGSPTAPISHAQYLFRSWNLRRKTSKRQAQAETAKLLDNLVAVINCPNTNPQPVSTPAPITQGVTVLLPKATRPLPPQFSIPGTPAPDNWIPPPDRELLSMHHVFSPIEHPTNRPINELTCAEIVRREFLWTRIRKRFARQQKKRKYKPRYKRTIITIEHEFTNDDTHTSPSVSPVTTISPTSPNRNIQSTVSQPPQAAYAPGTTRTTRT
jgi:hypothetical protein